MSELRACAECLRRSWLLAALGPYLEKVATGSVGRRSPELLRLSNEDLVEVAAASNGKELIRRVEARGEEWFAEKLGEAGCWAICRHDEGYPSGLVDAADGPWALIGRGEAALIDRLEPEAAVTVVGSRRATAYGRQVARDLSRELASAGMVVVSGLAFGIDACAHRGALDAGGPTIAVLGCGPDTAYPAAHRSLWRQVTEVGAVVSELPPGSTPWRWSLVYRKLFGPIPVAEACAYRPAVPVLSALKAWNVRAARHERTGAGEETVVGPERLWSLFRVDGFEGDWLLPDNNERTLWRLRIYQEPVGPIGGVRKLVPRWEIWRWRFELADALSHSPNPADESEWDRLRGSCRSRKEAMSYALEAGAGDADGSAIAEGAA